MAAKSDSTRVYTEQNPLVYEDAWDLWPYAFFNDNGEPDGFNIDLIRLIMKELNIPYIIRLRPQQQAFEDLRDRKSDLMLGLAVGFHDQYGLYGNNAITLFTQSVAAPKHKPTDIKTFRDLGKEGIKVIVNPNSMSYHLMIDYGWEKNAIPSSDLREVIQQVSAHEDGQIVWNTLSLKWLMKKYQTDNLEITPEGAAIMILNKADQEKFDFRQGESEGFVNLPLAVDRVGLSVFLTEEEDRFRVSVRSKRGVSANQFACRYFHGGGHEMAAGGRLYFPEDIPSPEGAKAYILKVTREFFGK